MIFGANRYIGVMEEFRKNVGYGGCGGSESRSIMLGGGSPERPRGEGRRASDFGLKDQAVCPPGGSKVRFIKAPWILSGG